MAPNVPRESCHQDYPDDRVEPVEVRSEGIPVLAEFHPDPAERAAPDKGADEGVEVEPPEVHARHSCREGDKGADHGQQAADEDRDLAVLLEPAIGEVQIMVRDQNVLTVLLDQGPSAVGTDP